VNKDQLEFAISRFLDGTLPAEDKAALELHVARDAGARQMLDQHSALDSAMKGSGAAPPVQWDRLAQRISGALTGQLLNDVDSAADDTDVPDELEYAIMQYVDGELPDEDRIALEKRLVDDPAARQVLAQHRSLDVVLKHSWSMPHVDFDRFGQHLSETAAEEAAPSSYSITAWLKYGSVVAAAACVLIVSALVVHFADRGGTGNVPIVQKPITPPARQVIQIAVGPEMPRGRAEMSVGVIPSEDVFDPAGVVMSARPRIQVDEVASASSGDGIFTQ
jgi:anti-sigma factor RsiW